MKLALYAQSNMVQGLVLAHGASARSALRAAHYLTNNKLYAQLALSMKNF